MILPTEQTGFTNPEQHLNEAQELVVPHMNEPKNILINFGTGSGKTACLCMIAHRYLFAEERKKLIYVAPMKALVEEKKRDWEDENHPYSQFNLAIITGDYVGTWEDDKTLQNADIIVITPESLASRLRNMQADKSQFLQNTGLLCIDEIHLIDESGRGANLEAALLEFTAEYPDVPVLGLSGTIPNAESLVGWMDKLNNLETVLIKSEYRSTELHKLFYKYPKYDKGEARLNLIDALDSKYPDEQKIIGVFAKSFGYKVERHLNDSDRPAEFHNADKAKDKRESIERKFRTESLQRLVATKTLAVGMNLPAKHVIITAAQAGGGDIKAYELNQFAGRAGRPQYDTEGFAHFFVPDNNPEYHIRRILEGEPIHSQFQTVNDVALHFLGAMYIGRIRTPNDFYNWYARTLRNHQFPLNPIAMKNLLDQIVKEMCEMGMIKDEDDVLTLKRRGEIAAQMGVDPYYLFDLVKNFSKFLAFDKPNDVQLAESLGNATAYYNPMWPNDPVLYDIPSEVKTGRVHQNFLKGVGTYYLLLKKEQIPDTLRSLSWQIKQDIERVGVVLDRLNYECEGWKDDRIGLVAYRVYYGIGWDAAFLIHQGCSEAASRRLLKEGIKDVNELKRDPALAKELLTPKQLKRLRL